MNVHFVGELRLPSSKAFEDDPSNGGSGGTMGDAIYGAFTTCCAIVVGLIAYGLVFDNGGGEPFSSTVFGAIALFPAWLVLMLIGGIVWTVVRTSARRLIAFGLFAMMPAIIVLLLSRLGS